MARKRLLMLLKPFDVYLCHNQPLNEGHKVLSYLNDRTLVHRDAVNFCQNILRKKALDWRACFRSDISNPICDVDLVITVGGDGTLLQASHFLDDSIPVLGVNSDPTRPEEVAELSEEFDATRSTGYLCAATASNFEQVLDDALENQYKPSELSRMSVSINSNLMSTYALNDILLAHPCPATVSRFSFRINKSHGPSTSLIHSRSSGLRVSTAAGSSAAMLSSGGDTMPILSDELQYLVREPICPGDSMRLMHGFVKSDEVMEISWFSREGILYVDGSHVHHKVQLGDNIELSSKAPSLKVYLPPSLVEERVRSC